MDDLYKNSYEVFKRTTEGSSMWRKSNTKNFWLTTFFSVLQLEVEFRSENHEKITMQQTAGEIEYSNGFEVL